MFKFAKKKLDDRHPQNDCLTEKTQKIPKKLFIINPDS